MTRHFDFLWLFALLLFLPTDGYAPCVVFTPPEEELDGTGQRAFIVYNPQTQQVNLVPSINFTGEATEFAIVIPTPSIPKLDTVDQWIFSDLNELTMPVTRWRSRGWGSSGLGCGAASDNDDDDFAFEEDDGVTIISEQEVGAFDTVILTADNPMALTDWLDEHGYHHSIEDNAILQSYIDQRWIFTAMRLSVTQFGGGGRRRAQFFDATVDPILLTYTAEKLIYPLRLTSISAREGADVTVYILTPNKMHFPSARVEYANRITDSEHDAIRLRYPTLNSFIGELRYLTRLRRSFARTEMDTDFELVRHQDNQEFRRVRYMGITFLPDLLLLGLVVIGYLVSRRIWQLRRWLQTKMAQLKEIN